MKWNKKRRKLQKLYDTKQKLRKQDLKLLVNLTIPITESWKKYGGYDTRSNPNTRKQLCDELKSG